MRIASAGHAVFAAALIWVGVLGLLGGNFPSLWQPVAKTVPAREALAHACAIVALACGAALLSRRAAAAAARVLLGWLALWLVVMHVPRMFVAFTVDAWWAVCKTAVVLAAAWVLVVWFASGKGLRFARALCGIGLIPFGLAHFLYLQNTAPLVPAWLPAHVFWAYFTGATFIAAGAALLTGAWARLAAVLVTLQMGLFTLLIWVPVVAAGTPTAFQKGEFVVSCVLTAATWVVADSWRAIPQRA